MAEVVIIGAGLTGLSVAYHLEQQGFFDYKLFEKEPTVGGLCRSVYQDGFTFDYTGHLLHINDEYFKQFIDTIVGLHHFCIVHRQSFIYSHNRYTRYPYQINLHGLPTDTIIECIEAFVNKPKSKKTYKSFYEWVIHSFGNGFAKHFFFPYQEKIFSYNVKKLTASWTGRFVPQTSLRQLLEGALEEKKDEKIGYNAQFFYPMHGGIYYWVDKLYKKLITKAHINYELIQIDTTNKKLYFSNGDSESYNYLVSTIPLDILLTHLKEPSHSFIKQARTKLLCNSVINFNWGIAREPVSDKHWIYFPESHFPFYRLGFPHNFSPYTVPTGHSSLYGEFSHLKGSSYHISETLKHARKKAMEVLQLTEHDIITEKIISIPHAYVIYNKWRDKNMPTILKTLENHALYSIGRYGAWKYSSMQEGILDGKTTAEKLLMNIEPTLLKNLLIKEMTI